MADTLLDIVLERLVSLVEGEIGLICGVGKEMKKLSSNCKIIKAVLEDAEQKQLQDKAIQIWLRKLKQAVYEIDDVSDECATKAAQLEFKGHNSGSLDKVCACFLSCYSVLDDILFRHKIGNKIKEINETLDEIAEQRRNFHLHEREVGENRVGIPEWRETSSFLTEDQVFGREKDIERIVKQLVVKDTSDCQDVFVLPILGIGGLGKTTLAQLVFNDKRVKEYFEPRIWVCVSDNFEVNRVIKAIIGASCGGSNLEELHTQLQKKLNGKRYLLVLDDVWNENQEKWKKLKSILSCGSKGASVITTSRVENVTSIMSKQPVYRLSTLSEDDCWSLFKQRAFKDESKESPNLVAIGKDIVKRCGGLPLAAKALGSLMCNESEESEWLRVKESEIWNLQEDKDEEGYIMPALRLSYHNLPSKYRQCFAYCAIFEKDSRIDKDRVIHLWMANGFISSNGTKQLEDTGDQIWNELYRRSFFQEVENDDFDNVESFKMHDLVHDLAKYIMQDECHVMEVERPNNKPNKSVHHVTSVYYSKALENVDSLRTLFVKTFSQDFMKFSTLRVLNASKASIAELPYSIGNLIHLRYLNLSDNYGLKTLPQSLCNLLNLQTLNLNSCKGLESLPNHMGRMINLRHLFMEECDGLTQMAPKIGQLTNLKSLSIFIVDGRRDIQLGELQGLNLGGKLYIKHLERVENWEDARETANLAQKANLCSLRLGWGSESENGERVLDTLKPHPNLKELIIQDYPGTSFPRWMSDLVLLQNLVRVSIYDKLVVLPEASQHVPALQWIFNC